jgi:glycosyltransferase involved in cell wall biosynthesis
MNGLSIIIAAHNEASVIEETLRSILANRLDRTMQIVVVANGCTDDTAARARSFGDRVQVIETATPGKANALNLGDNAAIYFPRAYLDADIQITDNALQGVVDAFKDPTCRVATPTAKHVYQGWNPFLAGYYQLWRSLPYVRNAVMGGGFYAIDRVMRSRFAEFPAITADDKFVHSLATAAERRVVPGCYATVKMPETFHDLLRVKTRWTYGNMELDATHPDLKCNGASRYDSAAGHLLMRPWLWPHIPAFVFVYMYTKRAARRRFAEKAPQWDRDNRTRTLSRESRPAA